MDISINSAGRVSPMKSVTRAQSKPAEPTAAPGAQDTIHISPEGREAAKPQAPVESRFSQMETLPVGTDQNNSIRAQLEEWKKAHPLEVNWNAAVDPDGSIYAKSYMESLVSQYNSARQTIEAYYAEGHQENLRFSNPYNHLVEKYKYSGSPYFKADMTQAQRDMAFRQEEALLLGGRVALNDPWALAGSGGVPSGQQAEDTARAYARSVLDRLIAEYKTAHGIEG